MSVMKLIQDQQPDAFVACWDTEAKTFRHEAFVEYKAHRVEKEDELYEQIPWIQEGLKLLGVPSLSLDGYEADDLIGTLALRGKSMGWEIVIVTGDRDALQLVQPGITVMAFKKGVTETKTYDETAILEEYGLTPAQFLEYKVMRGDPSDNIPGIKGIGEKGATELLKQYGTLAGIYAAAHDESSTIAKGIREKLLAAENEIPSLLELVTIYTKVPVEYEPVATVFPADRDGYLAFLRTQGFKTLVSKLSAEETNVVQAAPRKSHALHVLKSVTVMLDELPNLLAHLEAQPYVVVRVERSSQQDLFGEVSAGLFLADASQAYYLSASLIKNNKKLLDTFFREKKISFVTHDAKTEMRLLESFDLLIEHWWFDLMLASYVLGAGERNHDLGMIASTYAHIQIDQEVDTLMEVSVINACITPLEEALSNEHVRDIFDRFELPLVPVLRAMEREGILVQTEYLRSLSKEMTLQKNKIEKDMISLSGVTFNPASPTQLADVLFVTLGLPTKGIKRGKTGYSTAAQELEKLRGMHPIIELVEQYREVSKLLSTYIDTLPKLIGSDGRIHTTYEQAVTATGRLSSNEPNLQNIPIRSELGRMIRRAFVAKPGYKLLSCDYSQIELRLVARLAQDEAMLSAFERREDIHTATAASIWGISPTSVTKDQRRIAKAINFGLIFGQGPQGLSQSAGISFKEAKEFIDRYFDVYKGIKTYMTDTKALAHQRGYVETLFGRKRYIPEIHSALPMLRAQAERMAINMPVQGTEADLIKLAMIKIHQELPKISKRSRMLLQVHDELVFEVPEDEVASVSKSILDIMEHVRDVGVLIQVDAKYGNNWEEMSPVE